MRAQGVGVGRRLLAAVEDCAARAAATVVLHVLTGNASALALYASTGWRPLGAPVPHPLSGAPMLTLVRDPPPARPSRTAPRDTLSR
ncbi:GNAT family N-acetyltransferase [Rathayibacter tritici]|uniref:GNAT family N-acetyltransferase n=1 Tax=Rathayibacter tritici TaxID=33888 RepID=UPI0031FDA72F